MRATTKALVRHYVEALDLSGNVLEIGGHSLQQCAAAEFPEPRFKYHDLNITQSDIPNTIVASITDCRDFVSDSSFDIIYSEDVLEHIDRPWLAAEEISRILRPGGIAFVTTLWSWRNHPCPIDYWRFSPECLEFLFNGLTCLERGYDLRLRRRNVQGFWDDGRDSVPVDRLGGWRENWSVYIVATKGPINSPVPFRDTNHELAGYLRMDTQGRVTNRKLLNEERGVTLDQAYDDLKQKYDALASLLDAQKQETAKAIGARDELRRALEAGKAQGSAHSPTLRASSFEPRFTQELAHVAGADRKNDLDDYQATFGEEAVAQRRFLNIGAGAFSHPAWTNVDFSHPAYDKLHSEAPFVEHNLASEQPLPFDDDSAYVIYTSHTIEHLRNAAVRRLLVESYRVLKTGGIIRIVVPDIELAYRAYRTQDVRYFSTFSQAQVRDGILQMPARIQKRSTTIQQSFLIHFARQASRLEELDGEPIADVVDRLFASKAFDEACDFFTNLCLDDVHNSSPGDHINWFNVTKLESMLRGAGFGHVWRSGYGQSAYAVLRNRRYFDRTRPCFSLYMEAKK